jgi:hypothetical protein
MAASAGPAENLGTLALAAESDLEEEYHEIPSSRQMLMELHYLRNKASLWLFRLIRNFSARTAR